MNTIDKNALIKRLLEDGYKEENGLSQTVERLLSLSEPSMHKLEEWLINNTSPEFDEIEGISSKLLRDELKMKEAAIILSYEMLLSDAINNSRHLKNLISRRMLFKK